MFCTSASYLVARFHNVSFMHSKDTGPLDNLGPFGPIVKRYLYKLSAFFKQQMSNGRIMSVTDLDSLGGHYGVRFNALRWRALWGFNDRSHGTNPEC